MRDPVAKEFSLSLAATKKHLVALAGLLVASSLELGIMTIVTGKDP